MLLSIVIPAYNVEKYIKQCIISCIDSTYENEYEIIIVNDGSTDDTGKIIEQYSYLSNLVYIKKQNGGVSSARNIGLSKAKGKYVFFLDGDDYLEVGSIGLLLSKCEDNFDMVTFNFYKVDDINKEIGFRNQIDYGELTGIDSIITLIFTKDYMQSNWSPWGKLYKNDIINSNSVKFNEENYGSEDLAFNLELTQYLYRVYSSYEVVVNYRIDNSDSITKNVKPKTILSLLEVLTRATNIIDNYNLSKTTRHIVFNNLAMWYLYSLKRYHLLDRESKVKFRKYKNLNNIFRYSSIAKIRLCRLIVKIFGIEFSNIILRRF